MNRRDAIKAMGLGGFGLGLASAASRAEPKDSAAAPVLRVAHLTDIHLDEKNQAPEKFARQLRHLMALPNRPDFILNGGDTIMDAFAVKDRSRNDAQWKLWSDVFNAECDLEIKHCIGNHDIWGFGPPDDPLHGKHYAVEKMGLTAPYYSFDRGGWHFVVLDSVTVTDNGSCIGRLDDAQFEWLAADLAATPVATPILVMSHYPLLSATVFYPENARPDHNWTVPGEWMHIDFNRISDLFARHPNVRVCISGHMHQIDHVVFNDITYLCNGACCGGWWGNDTYIRSKAGYAVLNLYADGNVTRDFHHPAWA